MALKSQIENDVKAALLSGDRFRAEVLRGLKAAILNEEVAKGKREEGLDDATIEQIIAREVKKRLDSVQQYADAGRPELRDADRRHRDHRVDLRAAGDRPGAAPVDQQPRHPGDRGHRPRAGHDRRTGEPGRRPAVRGAGSEDPL